MLAATNVYELACELLAIWQAASAGNPGQQRGFKASRDVRESWSELQAEAEEFFRGRDPQITDVERSWVLTRLRGTSPGEVLTFEQRADAIAYGLDEELHQHFHDLWAEQNQLGLLRELDEGELYPVPDGIMELLPAGTKWSSRPAVAVDDHELPHIKQWRTGDVSIVFDWQFSAEVANALDLLRTSPVATVHPTLDWDELPRDEATGALQPDPVVAETRAREGLQVAREAAVVVFPELSLPAVTAERLHQELLREGREAIVVLGSAHEPTTPGQDSLTNCARIYLPGADEPLKHIKYRPIERIVGVPLDERISEGLTEVPPRVTVYCASQFRLAVVICRDLIDEQKTVWALARAGTNVILVPSLTGKTGVFVNHVGAAVALRQAHVVLANGPVIPQAEENPSLVLIGRPAETDPVLQLPSGEQPTSCGVYRRVLPTDVETWTPLSDT